MASKKRDPISAPASVAMARDSYGGPRTCALMGVHLFKFGPLIEGDVDVGPALYFCTGNRKWTRCAHGVQSAVQVLREQVAEIDMSGMRYADLDEDWGVICNEAGEITHRAISARGIVPMQYLGHYQGPLVDRPLTTAEAGIDPVTPRARHRG